MFLFCINNLVNVVVFYLIIMWRVGKLLKKWLNVNVMVKEKDMKICFICDCYNNLKEGEKLK